MYGDMDAGRDGRRNSNHAPSWDDTNTLNLIRDLNRQCLEVLREQALLRLPGAAPILCDLIDLWEQLDAAALLRAASCPFVLIDVGFADEGRWLALSGGRINDSEPGGWRPSIVGPGAVHLKYKFFSDALYLLRTHDIGLPLFMGLPTCFMSALQTLSQTDLRETIEHGPHLLHPRWPDRIAIWRELLFAAISGSHAELELARLHGVQLLASELRAVALSVGSTSSGVHPG